MTTLSAPAKLTWTLEVTGVREDGMHLLRSEMVSLSLDDTLEITASSATSVLWIDDVTGVVTATPEDDLIARALRLVSRTAAVTVRKNIPVGGGLGGGSSDAAAILRWAGVTDRDLALQLGGDVPFCLRGGRAMVEGVGEQVHELAHVARDVTLAILPFGVSTPACYRAYDELVRQGRRPRGRNHLFEPALVVEPRLATARDFVAEYCGASVELCGSGSTLFVEGHVKGSEVDWTASSPVGQIRFVKVRTAPAQGG